MILGGIYVGVFTPTEAAGIGAGGAFAFAIARKGLDWPLLRDVLAESAVTTVDDLHHPDRRAGVRQLHQPDRRCRRRR